MSHTWFWCPEISTTIVHMSEEIPPSPIQQAGGNQKAITRPDLGFRAEIRVVRVRVRAMVRVRVRGKRFVQKLLPPDIILPYKGHYTTIRE